MRVTTGAGRLGGGKGATELTVSAGTVHRGQAIDKAARSSFFLFSFVFFLHQDDIKCTEKNKM